MSDYFVQNNMVHISMDNREWGDYCEFLRLKLSSLEEERRNIDKRIKEIHMALNPEIREKVEKKEPEPRVEAKEARNDSKDSATAPSSGGKYLLVKDIANKYKATTSSVEEACKKNLIPYHWNSAVKEIRFFPEDVEKITSIASRKQIFESVKPLPAESSKEEEADKCKRSISAEEVYRRLGIGWYGAKRLRDTGFLAGRPEQHGKVTYYIYDESDVLAVEEIAREVGGMTKFLQGLVCKKATTR